MSDGELSGLAILDAGSRSAGRPIEEWRTAFRRALGSINPCVAIVSLIVAAIWLVAMLALNGPRIQVDVPFAVVPSWGVLSLLSFVYGPLLQRNFRLAWAVWFIPLYFMTWLGGALLAYACALWGRPEISTALVATDKAMQLDWVGYANYLTRHPIASAMLHHAYNSLMKEGVVLVVWLVVKDDRTKMVEAMLALTISLLLTDVLFGLFPSVTAPVGYDAPEFVLSPISVAQIGQILSGKPIHVDTLLGLVSFPSFHTAGAVLLAYLFRGTGVTPLAIILNTGIIAATPIFGGHYFVDIIGGALVASIAILAARWAVARCSSWPLVRAL